MLFITVERRTLYRGLYYRLVSILSGIAGFRGAEMLAQFLSAVRLNTGGKHAKTYLGHLKRIFPEESDNWRKHVLREYWVIHQRAFLGLFNSAKLTPDNLADRVTFSGLDILDRAFERGRGVFLLVPHFGDERTLHIALAIAGYPMHVISSSYEGAPAVVRKARLSVSRKWHHVAFPNDNPKWIFETMKKGEIIQTAPTAYGGPKGHWVESFGVPVLASSTPVRVAKTTDCALVVAFNHALPGFRHHIEFKSFEPGSMDEKGTAELFNLLEGIGRKHPAQYNWMNLVIRHRETNTITRLGNIPLTENVLEEKAMEPDFNPENIQDIMNLP